MTGFCSLQFQGLYLRHDTLLLFNWRYGDSVLLNVIPIPSWHFDPFLTFHYMVKKCISTNHIENVLRKIFACIGRP